MFLYLVEQGESLYAGFLKKRIVNRRRAINSLPLRK